MLPAWRSGNTRTLARPATGLFSLTFLAATTGTIAASACNSPSMARSGARSRTSARTWRTLDTWACWALPLVEKDSSAIRGGSPRRRSALRLIAQVPVIVATHEHVRNGREPVAPDPNLGHTANLLGMLRGEKP